MNKPEFGEPWSFAERQQADIYFRLFDRNCEIAKFYADGMQGSYGRDLADRAAKCVNACSGLSDQDLKAVPHVRELLNLLNQAELNCRGYDALHSWCEPAAELIAKAEGREGQDGKG